MIEDLIISGIWSISPLGEAKVGIPYGISKGVNIYLVFIVCYLANVLVFPLMLFFLNNVNKQLLKWKWYKIYAIKLAQKAKKGTKDKIKKYGFWGLIFFVMLPVPGTGVYAGTIASFILKINTNKAFWANCIGIFISSVIVWGSTLLAMRVI